MKRLKSNIIYVLLFSLFLTGCGQEIPTDDLGEAGFLVSEEEQMATENKVILPEHFSLPYDPNQSLDPISCPDGMQQVVSSLICESLFRLGPDFEPIPWLCSAYSWDAETLTYTLSLRQGVIFSDGTPLTAADVKASLNRAKNSPRYAARLSEVTKISADEMSVMITLSAPNTAFPSLLDIPIVKADLEESFPLGTGPYLFSQESSDDWLIANQTWWRSDAQPVDRIALVEAADQDTKLYRFTSHDVQLITADLTGVSPISASGNARYYDADTTILQYLGCNITRAPLDQASFRQVLSAGINRTHIAEAFLSGHCRAAQFPIAPQSPLYPSDMETRYTHEAFLAALAELDSVPERTLTLLVNSENQFKVSVAEYLAEYFTSAGVPMKVNALPWEEYTAALAGGQFDLYYGEVKLTADWNLSPLLATTGSLNYGKWTHPQTDHLLTSFASATDRTPAAQILCTHLQHQPPILPICFKSSSVLVQSNVLNGLEPTMSEPLYNLSECTIRLQASE